MNINEALPDLPTSGDEPVDPTSGDENIEEQLQELAKPGDTTPVGDERALQDFIAACRRVDDDPRERQRIRDIADLIDAEDTIYEQALDALARDDDDTALPLLRQSAAEGVCDAVWRLADLLERRGAKDEAISWYHRSADDGDPRAARKLVELHRLQTETNRRGLVAIEGGGDRTWTSRPARDFPPIPAPPPKNVDCASREGLDAPRFRAILAMDIDASTDPARGDDVQRFLRGTMYELLRSAFHSSDVPWTDCHQEDRGDGVLVVAPPGAPAPTLLDPLMHYLRAGLRTHNKVSADRAQIRLRVAVHAGPVAFDETGVSGNAVTHLFRLLESAAFKRAAGTSAADLALVASDVVYDEAIRQRTGLIDPDMYAPINIRRKETRARAWLYLPPVPHPSLQAVTSRIQHRESPRPTEGARIRSLRCAGHASC